MCSQGHLLPVQVLNLWGSKGKLELATSALETAPLATVLHPQPGNFSTG